MQTDTSSCATLGRWSTAADAHFRLYFAALLAASALAYVPLAVAFTPWAWSASGLFTMQLCRPLHYAVYFFAGVSIGVNGIGRGLVTVDGITVDGILAQHWARWLAAALASLLL
jgi:glucan biosynthesis protein C